MLFLIGWPILLHAQLANLSLNLGHTGAVSGLRFSADGKQLISSSNDRTMKCWDVQSGKLLQTSPEISDPPFVRHLFHFPAQKLVAYRAASGLSNWYTWVWGLEGNTLSDGSDLMARPVSPSIMPGAPKAPSGPPKRDYQSELKAVVQSTYADTGEPIYFTHGLGRQRHGFYPDGGHYYECAGDNLTFYALWEEAAPTTVTYAGLTSVFAFSSSGEYLFGSPEGPTGQSFSIWRVKDGTQAVQAYLPDGHRLHDISTDGRYALIADADGQVSLFDISAQAPKPLAGASPHIEPAAQGSKPGLQAFNQAVFSPDGRHIAVGGADGSIYLFGYPSGQLRNVLRGYTEAIEAARFSADGQRIQLRLSDGRQRDWDLRNRVVKVKQESTLSLPDEPPAGTIGGTPDGEWGVKYVNDNKLELWALSTGQKLRDIGTVREIMAPANEPERAVIAPNKRWLLVLNRLVARRPRSSHLLWDLEANRKVSDVHVPIDESVSATAFSADGQYLLLGDFSGLITVYEAATGAEAARLSGHENTVQGFAVHPTNRNRFLSTSTAQDGTAMLWDISAQEAIASLVNLGREDWAVIGQNGLFDASSAAMELMYYKVEQGPTIEIIELEQLKSRYYEPGLLQKLLGYADERLRPAEGLQEVALYPAIDVRIEQDELLVSLQERSGGLGAVRIYINGKEVARDANPGRSATVRFDLRPVQSYLFRHPDSTNTVSVRAWNAAGWLKSNALDLEYTPTAWARGSRGVGSVWKGELDPKMYVLCVGTSDYNGTELDLRYAARDANAMAQALQYAGANLFANGDSIEVYALTTDPAESTGLEGKPIQWKFASKANVEATFRAIQQKAKAEDVLIVYLSGHGVTHGLGEAAQFYYLTSSVGSEEMISDKQLRDAYTISSGELTEWINKIPALKQVLVVDACNSGKVVENLTGNTRNLNTSQIRALDRMKDRTGMFVLSGSAADKVSYEASEYGQGLLTYALLQGMMGVDARRAAEGHYVDVMRLFQYARDMVPELASSIRGIQTPMLGFPASGASFDIGIVKDQRNIPVGQKKPVFTRPVFLNQNTLDDDLRLINLLEEALQKEAGKGGRADLVYVPANDYPGAFSVKGSYEVKDDMITLKAKLFGNGNPRSLELPPAADPESLVRLLMRELKKALREP